MLYLASPYTSPHGHIMQGRYIAACHAAATIALEGKCVYSPIVHWHMVAVMHSLPRDFAFWDKQSFAMIDISAGVIVLQLEGWEQSIGVMKEIEYAQARGLPVTYMAEEEIQWPV